MVKDDLIPINEATTNINLLKLGSKRSVAGQQKKSDSESKQRERKTRGIVTDSEQTPENEKMTSPSKRLN